MLQLLGMLDLEWMEWGLTQNGLHADDAEPAAGGGGCDPHLICLPPQGPANQAAA